LDFNYRNLFPTGFLKNSRSRFGAPLGLGHLLGFAHRPIAKAFLALQDLV